MHRRDSIPSGFALTILIAGVALLAAWSLLAALARGAVSAAALAISVLPMAALAVPALLLGRTRLLPNAGRLAVAGNLRAAKGLQVANG